jgi:hypothetical protein
MKKGREREREREREEEKESVGWLLNLFACRAFLVLLTRARGGHTLLENIIGFFSLANVIL